MALPATSFPPSFNDDDAKLINMVTERFNEKRPHIVLAGLSEDYLTTMRSSGFRAWQIALGGPGKWMVNGTMFRLPFQAESIRMFVMNLYDPSIVENAVFLARQLTEVVEVNGFLFYDAKKAPMLHIYLPPEIWMRLPFTWHDVTVYQKIKHWKGSTKHHGHKKRDVYQRRLVGASA